MLLLACACALRCVAFAFLARAPARCVDAAPHEKGDTRSVPGVTSSFLFSFSPSFHGLTVVRFLLPAYEAELDLEHH